MLSVLLVLTGEFAMKEKLLENGLKIVAVKKDKLPIFHISIVIHAGSINDPKGKNGTAYLVGALLDEGTKNFSKEEITEKFEEMGTKFSVEVTKTNTTISLKTLTSNVKASLKILSDILMHPLFLEEEFEKHRKRAISSIVSQKGDPNYVSGILLSNLLYGEHPLAHPVEGYEHTLANIKLEDVRGFYESYFKPNNAFVVIVSDMEPEDAIELVEGYLSKWKKGEVPRSSLADVDYPEGRKAYVYHMKGINQVFVFLAGKGIARNHPDFNKARVANYILGGSGFSSRILRTIREEHGYAYWAYSYFNGGYRYMDRIYDGAFVAGFASRTDVGNHAISLLLEEIMKAKKEGFTQVELEKAKSYYEGSIARKGQSYGQLANLYINRYIWELPDRYWLKDIQQIKKLSLEEVNEAARKYIPDDFIMLVLTDTSAFKLKQDVFDEVEYRNHK